MDAAEAQAVDNLLRWLFQRAGPDGAPVSDERFCEAGLLLSRLARRALPASLGPEQIAFPLGHLVESRRLELPSIAIGVPIPGLLSPRGLLDGTATLAEAADRTREFADYLRALADAGYELDSPFLDDCAMYRARGPAPGRPDSGSAPEPI